MHIRKWQTETVSGTKAKEERKLEHVLLKLKKDDVLIVSEMSRLSRTMLEIMAILHICIRKEIVLYSVKEGYSFENNMTSKIMGFAFGMAAEIERNLIAARTKEALAYRKAQGMILGRPVGSCSQKKILRENEEAINHMLSHKIPKIEIAQRFGVSKATLYTYLKEKRCKAISPDD